MDSDFWDEKVVFIIFQIPIKFGRHTFSTFGEMLRSNDFEFLVRMMMMMMVVPRRIVVVVLVIVICGYRQMMMIMMSWFASSISCESLGLGNFTQLLLGLML